MRWSAFSLFGLLSLFAALPQANATGEDYGLFADLEEAKLQRFDLTGAAPAVGTLFQRDGGIARASMPRITPPIIRAPQRKA